jgi:hypothetical protein
LLALPPKFEIISNEIGDDPLNRRLKAARKLGITEVPVILCDEWTPAQVKAFRLMVNRSVTWADWDEELLACRHAWHTASCR